MRVFASLSLVSGLLVSSPALAQGTWNAADAYYDAERMDEVRAVVQQSHGGMRHLYLEADRLEYRSGSGEEALLWDTQAWYGGDLNRLWLKSEGEYNLDHSEFEEAEIQALYSRAVTSFFDLQAGIRQDLEPGNTTYAVVGIQGLAPYWLELDAAAFLSEDGDLTGRVEVEYELLITQRLVLQPRAELEWALEDDPSRETGAGLTEGSVGARLRYELKREVAPYVGVSWSGRLGETADLARLRGEDPDSLSLVAGIRLWF